MKKLLCAVFTLIIALSMNLAAFAYEYEFSSGQPMPPFADGTDTFGKPTRYDEPISPNPETENVRRNKDAASFPPPYGIFSGNIPTDPSSLYHDNSVSGGTLASPGGTLTDNHASGNGTSIVSDEILPSTSLYAGEVYNTAPLYYDDGSIGTLSIPKLKLTVKVFEGETLDSMKKGVGHFEATSTWDGNVGFAGHNRGAATYFGGLKNLAIGDTVSYTTKYGTRTYEVYYKEKIGSTDYSKLGWSDENILTLITCVENVPSQRWCLQCREVG